MVYKIGLLISNYFNNFKNKIYFLKNREIISNKLYDSLNIFSEKQIQDLLITNPLDSYKENNISYHSSRDPIREATKLFDSLPLLKNNNTLLCISCGLGYLLSIALHSFKVSQIIIIEPNLITILCLILKQDWSSLLHLEKLQIVYLDVEKLGEDIEDLYPLVKNTSQKNIVFYLHKPAYTAHPKHYRLVQDKVMSTLEIRMVNQHTLAKFQDSWNLNIIQNAPIILQSTKLTTLISYMKNYCSQCPIVIAGAGPSLEKSISSLKKYRKKYILFAVDTAYIPLKKNKIIPDIVFSSDPQFINHYYIMDIQVHQSLWCLDPVLTYHSTHHLHRLGATTIFWDNPFVLDKLMQECVGKRGEVQHGGSISTNAFDVAVQIKPKNIILVGHDLSFSNKKAHVKGSVIEENIFIKANRFYHFEDYHYLQMTALPAVPVKINVLASDENQQQVYTNAKMEVFIHWFQHVHQKYNLEDTLLWNATEKGVILQPFKNTSLDIFFTENRNITNNFSMEKFSSFVKSQEVASTQSIKLFYTKMEELQNDLQEVKTLLNKNINFCKNNNSQSLEALDKNDKIITGYSLANKMISLNSQKEIFHITENQNMETNKESPFEISKQFYQKMLNSCKYSIFILEKFTQNSFY